VVRPAVVVVGVAVVLAGVAAAVSLLRDEDGPEAVALCAAVDDVDLDRLRRPPLVHEEDLGDGARRFGITLVTIDDGNTHCSVEERNGSLTLVYHRND
jgi:hypothetical protein